MALLSSSFASLLVLFEIVLCLHENAFRDDLTMRYPKCCPRGLHLERNNLNTSCFKNSQDSYLTIDVTDAPLNVSLEECTGKCMDVLRLNLTANTLVAYDCHTKQLEELTDFAAYPKCCPLDRDYDVKTHKCTPRSRRQMPNLYYKLGIERCIGSSKVVVDHNNATFEVLTNKALRIDGAEYKYGEYCLDKDTRTGVDVVRTCEAYDKVCKTDLVKSGIPCFKKCCADGFSYRRIGKRPECVPTFDSSISFNSSRRVRDVDAINHQYGIIHIEKLKKYPANHLHNFFLDNWGGMHVKILGFWHNYTSKDAIYCFEKFTKGNTTTDQIFLLVVSQQKEKTRSYVTATLLGISAFAMFLTFGGYLILPEMKNLFGKLVMTFCLVGGCTFSILTWTHISEEGDIKDCVLLGYLNYFLMLAVFSWLTVICFDMWMTFGQLRIVTRPSQRKQAKSFLFYNIFAWSYPSVWVLATYAAYATDFLPKGVKPEIGTEKCFFNKKETPYYMIFLLLPESLLVITNIFFYIKTVLYCITVKNEINDLRHQDRPKRQKIFIGIKENFYMLITLGVVMGINWCAELVTSAISFKRNLVLIWIEMIFEYFNCSQGVFIFCIFMLKKKVLVSLKRKFIRNTSQIPSASTSSSSNLYLISKQLSQSSRKTSASVTQLVS